MVVWGSAGGVSVTGLITFSIGKGPMYVGESLRESVWRGGLERTAIIAGSLDSLVWVLGAGWLRAGFVLLSFLKLLWFPATPV